MVQKYTEKQRLSAVKDYISGNIGFREVARRHGVGESSLRKWIAAFRENGTLGLKPKVRSPYSVEFRLAVITRMREDGLSYRQTAALFDIRNFNVIGRWERRYDSGGLSALSPESNSRAYRMPKPILKIPKPDDDSRSREELLKELNALRMENAYLKKLDALVQAKKKLPPAKERK
jgi:transposase